MAKKLTKKSTKTLKNIASNKKAPVSGRVITVKNAEDTPDTNATILIQNKINYTPKVSVIIPVFNAADYLIECLNSVTNQTLSEIEIICVNDGSVDSSLEILQDYAKKDSRITVINQENHGAGIARNCGIGVARGEFVAFMDPDDFYPTNETLEHLYNTAIEKQVNICGGTMNRLKDGKIIVADEYLFNEYGLIKYSDYQFDYGYTRFIYNRKLLFDNNVLFPDYLRQQDPVFFVHAMIVAGKFYAIKEPTYIYRVSHTAKQIEWTQRKCIDVTKSLRDLLVLSDKANLSKLHKNMSDRVIQPYFVNVFKNLVNENGVPDDNLIKLLNALNYNIIYAENPNFSLPWFYRSNPNLCKISVIIPVYNVEKYLGQCLDSVINQTYKNLDIVCVNDGSTDNSLKILEKYAKKDSRIKVISQKNAGLNGARNTGLKNASGAYITFLDSDDWLDTDWIEKAYNVAIANNADMVKSGYLHHYKDRIEPDGINKIIDAKAKDNKYLGINENNIIACATLYDKAFIERNNIYFDTEIRKHEDILYTLKATFLANKIAPVSGTYLNYRRTSSILSLFDKNEYTLLPIINSKAIPMLNSFNSDKPDYITAVKRLWWRTQDAYEKRNQAPGVTDNELQTYLDKNYEIFRNVRWPYDIFDKDTIDKLGIIKNNKNALLVEINDCHGECLPGYCKYLLDLGYNVDVLVNKVLEKEAPMQMFDGNPFVTTRYISDKEIFGFLNSKQSDIYDVCVFNSNILYNEYHLSSILNFINLKQIKPRVLCVEHRLENLPELTRKVNVLVLKKFYDYRNTFEVNPHYFGENQSHDKGKTVNFVVAGNIQKTRKNYDLLINAVNELVSKNITNFKITVIGHGNLGDLPEKIQKFFDIKGRVSYPDLYKYVSNADFFMTLLDPDFSEHDRYLKHGTSGSFQLIYGLNIPCLIASKFAECHHFSSENAICYNKNSEIASAMIKCINMSNKEYKEIKDNLQKTADKIYKNSLQNMDSAIKTTPKSPVLRNWLLLPYYLLSNIGMKCVRLPILKFKKHVKSWIYSHSHRGKMDMLNNNFRQIMSTMQSVQNNIQKQIDNVKSQQNELVKQLNNNANNTKSQIDSVISENQNQTSNLTQQIDMLKNDFDKINGTLNQNAKAIDVKYHELSENISKNISEHQKVFAQDMDSLSKQINDIMGNQASNNKHIDNVLNNIEKRILTFEQNNKNLFIKNYEPYWANVYHDTINNSHWLANKSVSPGRWAVSYIVLYVLYRILDEIKPQSILECGLGQSSKLTIQYTESHNADLTICENNPEWLSFFMRQFSTADKYTKILDTEMVHIVPEYESRTYKDFKSAIQNKKFNLVLIDGPLGSAHYSRPEILETINNLDKSFVILMDDMNRIGEQETFELLKTKLHEKHINFKETIYESDKKLGLICSPDLEWLTTL